MRQRLAAILSILYGYNYIDFFSVNILLREIFNNDISFLDREDRMDIARDYLFRLYPEFKNIVLYGNNKEAAIVQINYYAKLLGNRLVVPPISEELLNNYKSKTFK